MDIAYKLCENEKKLTRIVFGREVELKPGVVVPYSIIIDEEILERLNKLYSNLNLKLGDRIFHYNIGELITRIDNGDVNSEIGPWEEMTKKAKKLQEVL